jgi:hypothetical protein
VEMPGDMPPHLPYHIPVGALLVATVEGRIVVEGRAGVVDAGRVMAAI